MGGLVDGPRGRALCLTMADRLQPGAGSALYRAARRPGDPRLRSGLVAALAEVDPAPLRAWIDPTSYIAPIAASVAAAQYWQEPDEEDVVAAHQDVVDALRPVADAISSSRAAASWSDPADLTALVAVDRYDPDGSHPEPPRKPLLGRTASGLATWRATVDGTPSTWWSTPGGPGLPHTGRSLPGLGSTELAWEEDTVGHSAARVWAVAAAGSARVYEITGVDAWAALVDRYPLEVTHSREDVWRLVTGMDGPWYIPDYAAAASDWDGIHLTVNGYLEAATRVIPIDDRRFTLLGGWDPDVTWWLDDVLTLVSAEPADWRLDRATEDEVLWHHVSETPSAAHGR